MFDVDELATRLGTRKTTIGVSGGVDSMVLLYIISQNLEKFRCDLSVVTVNHNINANSDAWAEFAGRQCTQMGIPGFTFTVKVNPNGNLENAAREARYSAFAAMDPEAIVLAHHADDQAETVLMKLFRGSGAKGLKGMEKYAPSWHDPKVLLCRPMLEFSKCEIETYARICEIPYVQDPSNADIKYDRNWIRNELMPDIKRRNPLALDNICKTASIVSESLELMRDLAEIDLAAVKRRDGSLDWPKLCTLSHTRLKNLLMRVLEQNGVASYSTDHIEDFSRGLLNANSDSCNEMRIGKFRLQKRGHRVIIAEPM
jgi:tRNA(Ile)-lysidine synthase